ncbi:MAG: hypothetical protein V4736_08095 [Bdellovibrionota bacterium]
MSLQIKKGLLVVAGLFLYTSTSHAENILAKCNIQQRFSVVDHSVSSGKNLLESELQSYPATGEKACLEQLNNSQIAEKKCNEAKLILGNTREIILISTAKFEYGNKLSESQVSRRCYSSSSRIGSCAAEVSGVGDQIPGSPVTASGCINFCNKVNEKHPGKYIRCTNSGETISEFNVVQPLQPSSGMCAYQLSGNLIDPSGNISPHGLVLVASRAECIKLADDVAETFENAVGIVTLNGSPIKKYNN